MFGCSLIQYKNKEYEMRCRFENIKSGCADGKLVVEF